MYIRRNNCLGYSIVSISHLGQDNITAMISILIVALLVGGGSASSGLEPRILSALYGYDDCIGGERDPLQSEEDYLEDLRDRGCTVEGGRTNVPPRDAIQ